MLLITILHKNSIHPQKIFRIRQQYILDNILVHILVHCAMNSMQWPHAMHRKTTPYLNSTSTSNGGHNAVQIQFFTDLPPDIYCVNIYCCFAPKNFSKLYSTNKAVNTLLSKPGTTAQLSIKQLYTYILSLPKGRRNNLKKGATCVL